MTTEFSATNNAALCQRRAATSPDGSASFKYVSTHPVFLGKKRDLRQRSSYHEPSDIVPNRDSVGKPFPSFTTLACVVRLARPPVDLHYHKRVQVNDPNKLFAADIARRFIDSCGRSKPRTFSLIPRYCRRTKSAISEEPDQGGMLEANPQAIGLD